MKITWIGQGGFLFEHDGCRVAVDPYLSDCLAAKGAPRLFPAPFTATSLAPCLLICTHDHLDHYDPDTVGPVLAANPACLLAGPPSVVRHAGDMGFKATTLTVGQPFKHGAFTFTPTPADHSDPQAIGLLVAAGGRTVYLSGDTLYRPNLAADIAALGPETLDLVLICINGRLGNMNLDEAVRVVETLRPRLAIPMHYGLFASNTVDPAPFLAACAARHIPSRTLQVADPVELDEMV